MVIPAMDIIDQKLSTLTQDGKLKPLIRAALGLSKKTMNRYYSKTDMSDAYQIAMSMSFSLFLP